MKKTKFVCVYVSKSFNSFQDDITLFVPIKEIADGRKIVEPILAGNTKVGTINLKREMPVYHIEQLDLDGEYDLDVGEIVRATPKMGTDFWIDVDFGRKYAFITYWNDGFAYKGSVEY